MGASSASSPTTVTVHGWFPGDKATSPFFSFSVVRSKMRDIMAGLDEKDRVCCCSSTSPLYMTVICPVLVWPEVYSFWSVLGDDSRNGLRIQHFLVRLWLHVRRQSTVAFGRISFFFYVMDIPEVDSRPGAVRTGNLDNISTSSSYDVVDGFFAAFCGIFRTPSAWT